MTHKEWWLLKIEGYSLTDSIRFEPEWNNYSPAPKTFYEFEQWIYSQPDGVKIEIVCEYWNNWKKFSIEPDGEDKWLIDLY